MAQGTNNSDLIINGNDALDTYGVQMGRGFLDAILAFAPMKEYVSNKSRLQHGKRVVLNNPKIDSRDLTLSFTIMKGDDTTIDTKVQVFKEVLQTGKVEIKIPKINNDIYRLLYTGKSVTYAMGITRSICTITAKFEEPDPTNRGETDNLSITQ